MRCVAAMAALVLAAVPAAAQGPAEESPQAARRAWTLTWADHPGIEWRERLRAEFRGQVQADGLAAGPDTGREGDGLDVSRRRVGANVAIGRALRVQIDRELTTASPWREVSVDYRRRPAVQVQAGVFKLPFGLEATTGGAKVDFVYRALASRRLAPGRDHGVMMHGRLPRRTVVYEVGVFAHDGDNARPRTGSRVSGGRTVAGRVSAEPFRRVRSVWSSLAVGAALADSALPEGLTGLRRGAAAGDPSTEPDHWVHGRRRRMGVQARWRPGPFSVASEFIRVAEGRRGQGVDGGDLRPLVSRGWYLSGAWVVLGARHVSDAAVPRTPLFRGGVGSIQAGVRLDRLVMGRARGLDPPSLSPRAESVRGSHETVSTAGATWRPVRWVSVRADVIHDCRWSRVVRVQLTL